MKFIPITIGVLNSRKEMILNCLKSIERMAYPTDLMELLVIDNLDNKYSIGAGFNSIVKRAKHEWILFLGDDDLLARTYLFNASVYLQTCQEKHPEIDIVSVTSNIILLNKEKRIGLDVSPTGMWRKDFLLENRFNEDLERYIDTDLFARVNKMEDKAIFRDSTNYGYYYVQHQNNVSYNKFDKKTRILNEIAKRQKQNGEYGG